MTGHLSRFVKPASLLSLILALALTFIFPGCGGDDTNTPPDQNPAPVKPDTASTSSLEQLKAKAGRGDANSMYELGRRYLEGDAVTPNDTDAINWLQRAAKKDHAKAARLLGTLYHQGRGTTADYDQAIQWYQSAAKLYDIEAMKMLGIMRCVERAFTKDYHEALLWFDRAAGCHSVSRPSAIMFQRSDTLQQGYAEGYKHFLEAAHFHDTDAMCIVGRMLELGVGVKKNPDEAKQWYLKAAERNSARAMANMGMWYRVHPYLPDGKTPDDVREHASQQAEHWFKQAAEHGNPYAMTHMAIVARVEGDIKQAAAWYDKAVDQGDTNALFFKLTADRKFGSPLPIDALQQGIDAGSDSAMDTLAGFYLYGEQGVERDLTKARALYEKAAKQINISALYHLGEIHHHGWGVTANKTEALKWCRKAAALGNTGALETLARIHEEGDGVPRDDRQALHWYRIALAHDSSDAKSAILRIERRLAGQPVVPEKFAEINRILASLAKVDRIEVDVMEPATTPEIDALTRRFQLAVAANRDWFVEHSKKAKPGEPLPYDPRLGLTRDEYDKMTAAMKNLKLRKQRTAVITIGQQAEGEYVVNGDQSLPALSGVGVDLVQDNVSSLYAEAKNGKPLDTTDSALVGAVRGADWRYSYVSDDRNTTVFFTFAVGQLKGQGKNKENEKDKTRGFIYFKAIAVTPGVRDGGEYILYFDLAEEVGD